MEALRMGGLRKAEPHCRAIPVGCASGDPWYPQVWTRPSGRSDSPGRVSQAPFQRKQGRPGPRGVGISVFSTGFMPEPVLEPNTRYRLRCCKAQPSVCLSAFSGEDTSSLSPGWVWGRHQPQVHWEAPGSRLLTPLLQGSRVCQSPCPLLSGSRSAWFSRSSLTAGLIGLGSQLQVRDLADQAGWWPCVSHGWLCASRFCCVWFPPFLTSCTLKLLFVGIGVECERERDVSLAF